MPANDNPVATACLLLRSDPEYRAGEQLPVSLRDRVGQQVAYRYELLLSDGERAVEEAANILG